MIKLHGATYSSFKFPKGEINVKIESIDKRAIDVELEFNGSDDIMELLLVCDAIKRCGVVLGTLIMDYVPFGRQDRVMQEGESLSLKVFCDLINSLNFKLVKIMDTHSGVTTALLNNCVEVFQHEVLDSCIYKYEKYYLISPDGGALKKIYKLAEKFGKCDQVSVLGVIECTKKRNVMTGEITETVVHHEKFNGETCVMVDDICDGGRTFIEIAKVLKAKGCGKVVLCVTHGFFTKGLEVFDGLIDDIYTNQGKVK